jgi:hypothetical protein
MKTSLRRLSCVPAAIFTPEHGLAGAASGPIASGVHQPTGAPIHSLFRPLEDWRRSMFPSSGICPACPCATA